MKWKCSVCNYSPADWQENPFAFEQLEFFHKNGQHQVRLSDGSLWNANIKK